MDPIIQAVALRYRIASNVARRFAAVIDKNTLEQWKKDLRVMTKIYRDVPVDYAWDDERERQEVYDRFKEAQKIFRGFRDNFEAWIYKVILPKLKKDEGTYSERAISKSAWDFRYSLDAGFLFPTMSGNIPDIAKFKNEREKNIKRYQTAATKAFKDLDEYLASSGGALQRRDREDHFEVGGVSVIVENWGRKDDAETEAEFHMAMNQLRKRIDRIKGAGFDDAVKGLIITMTFDQKEWDTNGMYNPATDKLTLYPLALAGSDTGEGTLTHEIGHRFYFRDLPGQARAHWDEVMENRGLKITREDIDRFTQAVIRGVNPDKLYELYSQDDLLKKALPATKSLSDEVKFKELARVPAIQFDQKTFDPQRYVDFLTNNKEGEVVQIEEITDYGNTNPTEAFAECFRLWVIKGPRALGPWTQEFFKTICRAGGAKVASDHGHYTEVCGKCGTVISQCRCMSPNKTVKVGLCDECAGIKREDPLVQWFSTT